MERLPGFRDFYPEPLPGADSWSADARQYIFERWRAVARRYGFREYDGPPVEPLELYTTKSGEEIVGQLYNFEDKGGRSVALRPEMTPTVARMIAACERSYKKPVKWFAIPQLFRFERQQKGRLKEHFQLNADIFGESDPAAEAELIALLIDTLRAFGLGAEDFVIRLSSRDAWEEFHTRRRAEQAPGDGGLGQDGAGAPGAGEFYQVIDKLDRADRQESARKLEALGFSLGEVTEFIERARPTPGLESILGSLEARGLREFVRVDYQVVRGLAYYTGAVFEAFDRKGEFRAIAGGGRYDNLVELVSAGKVRLPALGFGMGDVVLAELLKARGLLPVFGAHPDVYCLIEDERLRAESLKAVQALREAGFSVEYPLTRTNADKQFKRAMEMRAGRTLRIERAVEGGVAARVKNLTSRKETVGGIEGLVELVKGA